MKDCKRCPNYRFEQEDMLDGNGPWYDECRDGRHIHPLTGKPDKRFPYNRPWCFGGLESRKASAPAPQTDRGEG